MNYKKRLETTIEWRKNNKEHIKKYNKEYRSKHIIKRKEDWNKWISTHKEERKKYMTEYNKTYSTNREKYDISFKLARRLRHRIYLAVRNNWKPIHMKQLIGCSIAEYKQHIENQFKPGMTWENWNFSGWHIDHIIPCDFFDLNNLEERKKCFHYTNTQPLWANENLRKSNKILIRKV